MWRLLLLRRTGSVAFHAAVLLCVYLAPPTAKAAGLECASLTSPLTPPLPADIMAQLPKGKSLEQADGVASAVTLLRQHGLSLDSTIDHLVALYCPIVSAETGLTHKQRLDRMKGFARQARRLFIGGRRIDDVIFSVPLDPAIADAASMRARRSGMTIERWIAQTVEATVRHTGSQ